METTDTENTKRTLNDDELIKEIAYAYSKGWIDRDCAFWVLTVNEEDKDKLMKLTEKLTERLIELTQ